jgi:pyridoxine 5-phosphate synthase
VREFGRERPPRLGVNIDHVATLRNARGSEHPDPLRAARMAQEAGADGITAHLREDRRHVRDSDITRLACEIALPLNLEMAATEEMCAIALAHRPHAVCLVPERRLELTTEGGLDAVAGAGHLGPVIAALGKAGIRVSLFIDPDPPQIAMAARLAAFAVELHTGRYCEAEGNGQVRELERLRAGAVEARRRGLECHAGHGLDYATAGVVAAIPDIVELNIGHFLVGEAVFLGLGEAVRRMRAAIARGRGEGLRADEERR